MLRGSRLWSILLAAVAVSTPGLPLGELPSSSGRETLSLDWGWRFHLGDIPPTAFPANSDEAQGGGKGGAAWGAAAPAFKDDDWKRVNLPHDWVVEQPFDLAAVRNQGYRRRGIAWYRRQFRLPDADRGEHLELQFDAVSTHCTVWVNGSPVHHQWNGYTSFTIDITSLARFEDQPNTVAVRDDAEAMEGWWYEGGGIYRHTWLIKSSPVHVATDGLEANPVKEPSGTWTIPAKVTLENSGTATAHAQVRVELDDPLGRKVALLEKRLDVAPWHPAVVCLPLTLREPKLWSPDRPTLYIVKATVLSGALSDEVWTRCGFRTVRFDPKTGFLLNEQPLKIQGVCCHQDHAGVGVAIPDSLWDFRIRRLKEMGTNAYRCAHNPPAKEFLDACDRLGMLVMDENRHFDTSAETLHDLQWLVRRDRNHPSVILWSLFNEENDLQATEQGRRMTRQLVSVVKSLDSTRPVTAAQNGGQLQGSRANRDNAAQELDVVGVNYQFDLYDKIRVAYPDKPIISSEDGSQVMTRGAFTTDWQKLILASYDDKYPGWTAENRASWEAIARQRSFAGGFYWTGFDYRGEPSPFGWPAVSSNFGCLDTCGFPKTGFYIRQALWVHDRPVLKIVPHWNWAGREGQMIRVMAMTNVEQVSLYLNGKLLATKPADPFRMVEWQVPYAPGRLEAIGSKHGHEVARDLVETTGEPVELRLVVDRDRMAGNGCDAEPISVEAVDSAGRVVPTASVPVQFSVSGAGSLIGVGNGDPTSHEPDKASTRNLFNGLAQVIVQSARNRHGRLILKAESRGLKSAEIRIDVQTTAAIPSVP